MIKLVAVDLDDTLLSSQVKISDENKKAIQACKNKGIYFTFATGRMFRAAVNFARELDIELPIITYQGALTKTLDEKEIEHHVIEKDQAAELVDFLKSFNMQINVYMDDYLYVEEMNEYGDDYVKMSKIEHRTTKFPAGITKDPTKILMAGDPKRLDIIKEEAIKIYGDKMTITKSKEYFLEFGNLKAKKSVALDSLAKSLGINVKEVMAIGDGMNDLDMISYAGLGIAMGNATEEVKEAANHITDSNDNDGVAKAIKKFIL